MFACANKNNSQANILCFYFCQSHALKRLDFTKINLSSLKIPRKRKDNLKISGSFHPSISSAACTHTTWKYSLQQIIVVMVILFYYICAPMVNIILINFPSISFQINIVAFFVSIINNAN
jgi:hypothetical protein